MMEFFLFYYTVQTESHPTPYPMVIRASYSGGKAARGVKLNTQLHLMPSSIMRGVCKVRGLTLLLQVVTLWRCGDGVFFEVRLLASDALLTTLHPLLENVL
jgi:hypothetical protein